MTQAIAPTPSRTAPQRSSRAWGLEARVYLDGNLVEDRVFSAPRGVVIGRGGDLVLPVPAGAPYLASVQWLGHDRARVRDGRGREYTVTPEQGAAIGAGSIELHLSLVQRFAFRRTSPMAVWGSVVWLAMVLATTLVTQQLDVLMAHRCDWFGIQCRSESDSLAGSPLTAEYLERILRKDFAGEEVGVIAMSERPPQPNATQSFYMPAGDAGPVTKMGGAQEIAPEPVRGDEGAEPEKKTAAPLPPLIATEGKGEPIAMAEPAEEISDRNVDGQTEQTDEPEGELNAEEHEGWGIRDWYDAEDARLDKAEIDEALSTAHERLRIDPDDADALSMLSYYQYLAQDYDGADKTYQHFIKLYPESAAGYNNHALVYKRRGDYRTEEALYLVALALHPSDVTALNNYAVNLSHQHRFDEALAIMKQLETLDSDEPYADLHRAKIYAEMGENEAALRYLELALEGMKALDTLHHIEFRQDIRVDPSFEALRGTHAFQRLMLNYYGEDTPTPEMSP